MISGTTVTVLRSVAGLKDRFGNPTKYTEESEVADVLVSPGATEDLEASRPEGVAVAFTLHFPKTFTGSLEGCTVVLPEPWANKDGYRVIGDPRPYMDANTPTRWNRPVEVEAAHG